MNELTNDETKFNGHTRYVHRPLPAAPIASSYTLPNNFLTCRTASLTKEHCKTHNPKEVDTVNEITTTVEIADRTGHTTLQLTQQETLDRVAGMEGAWVFAGDRMVQPAELAEANWDTVGAVRLVPGLVGGI